MKRALFGRAGCFFLAMLVGGPAARSDGAQHRDALIVFHNDWGAAAVAARSELRSRGYSVRVTGDAAGGLAMLRTLSERPATRAGDFMVVYLAGHGASARAFGDTSRESALDHLVEFVSGTLTVRQVAPLFERIASRGVHLSVIDGSCEGGETVLYAMGHRYCAMATTGVHCPSLTNLPYPSTAMHLDASPGRFGTWGDYLYPLLVLVAGPSRPPYLTASWMNGAIVAEVPQRIGQRLFRNDNAPIATLSLFLRPSLGLLAALDMDGWTLHYQYCYLFRYIYPDEFASLDAAERSRFTNSVATYLASVHSMVDPGQPHFAALDGYLRNTDLISKAARVYAMQHKLVWQTLARDPSWNVAANPGLHAEEMVDLRPDSFAGEEGFLRIAGWIEFYVTMLQGLFARQEALLQEIDAAVRDLLGPSPHALPDPARRTMKVAWPPERGAATLRFNQFEREVMRRVSALERRLNVDQLRVLEPSPSISPRTLSGPTREARKADALRSIDQAAAVYRGSYATVITDRMGIPEAALKTPKSRRLAGLISQFKALTPIIYRDEKRLSFLLSIFEDAMLRAELDGPSPSAQVQF